MTLEITQEHVYIGIIVVLAVVQIFQWSYIRGVNKVVEDILEHIRVITTLYGQKIIELEKKIKDEK